MSGLCHATLQSAVVKHCFRGSTGTSPDKTISLGAVRRRFLRSENAGSWMKKRKKKKRTTRGQRERWWFHLGRNTCMGSFKVPIRQPPVCFPISQLPDPPLFLVFQKHSCHVPNRVYAPISDWADHLHCAPYEKGSDMNSGGVRS